MKRLMMFLVTGILLVPVAAWAVVDGFDYPIGKPNGSGYYVCQDFLEQVTNSCEHISWNGTHLGEDWNRGSGSDDCGDDVFAAANGTIVYAQNNVSGWGRVLIIRHTLPNGSEVETQYGHLASFTRTSGSFTRGEKVGTIGDGGGLYPCHLHFELRFSNCSSWGAPGPGYSSNHTGWTDPSDYIDAHRSVTPAFAASKTGQSESISPWMAANTTRTLWVDYKNVGTTTWENFGGVTNPEYVELRSLTGSDPCVLTNGCAYDPTWTNPQRIETFVTVPVGGSTVATNATARFQFIARAGSATGTCVQWVAPWVSGGTCMQGWGGVNFTIRTDATPPNPFAAYVSPSTSNTNSFAFSWDATADDDSGLLRYYWSVNGGGETPTTATSVPAGARATQQGTNTLTVRAVDNVGNSRSASATFTLTSSPCPGREIPHACVPSTQCYPASAANLQTLPTMSPEQWGAVGQPVRELLQPGKTYSIGFEYRSTSSTEMKLGLGTFNPTSLNLGLVVSQSELPVSTNDWRTYWSAPFSLTGEQLQQLSRLRLTRSKKSVDGFEIRNVKILAYQ